MCVFLFYFLNNSYDPGEIKAELRLIFQNLSAFKSLIYHVFSLTVSETNLKSNFKFYREPHFEFQLLWWFSHPVISHYSGIHLVQIKIFPLGSQSEGHHSAPVGSQGHWPPGEGTAAGTNWG